MGRREVLEVPFNNDLLSLAAYPVSARGDGPSHCAVTGLVTNWKNVAFIIENHGKLRPPYFSIMPQTAGFQNIVEKIVPGATRVGQFIGITDFSGCSSREVHRPRVGDLVIRAEQIRIDGWLPFRHSNSFSVDRRGKFPHEWLPYSYCLFVCRQNSIKLAILLVTHGKERHAHHDCDRAIRHVLKDKVAGVEP